MHEKRQLPGGVQLREQAFQVSQPLGLGGMLQRLVLGKDVDKALADVVAVFEKQLSASVWEPGQDVSDLALGRERAVVRHPAAPRRS